MSSRTIVSPIGRLSLRISRPELSYRRFASTHPHPPSPTSTPKSSNITPISTPWPWKAIAGKTNGLNPNGQAGDIVVEKRTIYARPPAFRPKVFWVVIAIWLPGCLLMADNLTIVPRAQEAQAEAKAKSEATAATAQSSNSTATNVISASTSSSTTSISSVPASPSTIPSTSTTTSTPTPTPSPITDSYFSTHKNDILAGALISIAAFSSMALLVLPTRLVVKLVQARQVMRSGVAAGPGAGSSTSTSTVAGAAIQGGQSHMNKTLREWIEIESAATCMWVGPWGRPREVPVERVSVGLISGGRPDSPYLALRVEPSLPLTARFRRIRTFLDSSSYRLDFRKVNAKDYTFGPDAPRVASKGGKGGKGEERGRTIGDNVKDRMRGLIGAETEEEKREIVVSLKRLQEVFGKLA